MLQLPFLVLVIFGHGILVVLNGFIPISSYVFRPKSALILLSLFLLPEGNYQSPCARISMEYLDCLAYTMSLSPNRALIITRNFNPIVITDNKRCYILVRLVSTNFSVVNMYVFLAVFIPNGVYSDGVGGLLS